MQNRPLRFPQGLGHWLLAVWRGLWRALAHPPVSLVVDPARLAGSAAGRPVVLVPGRILVIRGDASGNPR